MNNENMIQLSALVNQENPNDVLKEVIRNFTRDYPIKYFTKVKSVFDDFLYNYRVAESEYPSDSEVYYDRKLSSDVFLAFSRLTVAYNIQNDTLPVDKVKLGLCISLFREIGRLEKDDISDRSTTIDYNAKTAKSVIDYFKKQKLFLKDLPYVEPIIRYSDIYMESPKITIKEKIYHEIAAMIGTANLIGQMSGRTYLEKLFFLYDEVRENKVINKDSVGDILKFWVKMYREKIKGRLKDDLKGLYTLYKLYFKEICGLDKNLYVEAIEKQLQYLEDILKKSPEEYMKDLKRRKEYEKTE
jgi:hypothetical protein